MSKVVSCATCSTKDYCFVVRLLTADRMDAIISIRLRCEAYLAEGGD